ncbi:LCP family glycopolymer transferase [Listeria ivanovii]|uniref:LCP family glycopolymer transferase n=1 Tax=Listeria ivanovii TaxID=1638 RepID=UPI00209BEEB3|nr:LCP family protein [Listeria ivanovii]
MEQLRKAKNTQRKKRTALKIFLIILLIIILGLGALIGWAYWKTSSTFDNMYKPLESSSKTAVSLDGTIPFSILILGIDERDGDRGRSDTLIAATVNGDTNQAQMLSIPRDTRAEIVGHNTTEKINAAYAYGDVKMAQDTTTKFLNGIPFNYYIKINMEGFREVVDAVGGIDVYNNTEGISYNGREFKKGNLHLNGEKALQYVRIRKTDPNGDFGRQKRQQESITAVSKKVLSTQTVFKLNEILESAKNNIETDFTMADMTKIVKNYGGAVNNVESITMAGDGGKLDDGLWYYVVSEAERIKMHTKLAKNLNIK